MARSTQDDSGRTGADANLRELLQAIVWPTVASAGGAALTAVVLWIDLPASLVLSWAGLAALAHGAALALWHVYRTAPLPSDPKPWLWRCALGALAVGVVWGSLAIAVLAGASSAESLVYAAAFAIMAGAAVALSVYAPAVNAVIWPVAVPLSLVSGWMGDPAHLTLAVLLPLFAAAMSVLGRHLNRLRAEAVAARSERDRMAVELTASNSRLATSDAELARANQRLVIADGDLVRAHAEAEAASRAKSEFLANMSHELRTPLNAIIGFAEVIERETFGPTGSRYREYASDIHGSGRHLLQVINDILDLSKVEAGQMLLHEARLDPALVMQGCVRLIRPRASKSSVRLYMAFDPNLPVLLADEARLRQIGLNLLSNAVKFTKAGGRVSISTGLDSAGGITISVADTGIGMTEDEIRIALEPFRQVTSSLSRTNEGTGLGLPLTKTLVELHGGRLDIASAPGRGTTVTVTFPPSRSLAQPAEEVVQSA
jgi:signal transduction histidine kinase